MNEATIKAITARAEEAQILKHKTLKELRSRLEGLIFQIDDGRSELSDLIMLGRETAEAIRIVAVAEEKIQTEELVKAFAKR